jgi:two-component system chemotaxis response regulator CheY
MPLDASILILVVDDSETIQRIVCKLLQSIGCGNVVCARNGMEALQKLHEKKFGLVISDWYMESMTGLKLTERIRADPAIKNLPVILISAVAKADNVIAAKEAGVDAYMVKPFSAEALKLKIEAALAAR